MSIKSNQEEAQRKLIELIQQRAALQASEQASFAKATEIEQKTGQATTYAVIGIVVLMVLVVIIALIKKK